MAELLGYHFKHKPALAVAAMLHSSLVARHKPKGAVEHFERLEFLGDRVLGLSIASWLMELYPQENEGQLTRRHTALVRAETLAQLARKAGLPEHLKRAVNEGAYGGDANDSILSDALEAALGAIFLDGGFSVAEAVVRKLWQPLMAANPTTLRDPKSHLQEWAQAKGLALPTYEMLEQSGSAHLPQFKIQVKLSNGQQAIGQGHSKRVAEQQAATALLVAVGERKND